MHPAHRKVQYWYHCYSVWTPFQPHFLVLRQLQLCPPSFEAPHAASALAVPSARNAFVPAYAWPFHGCLLHRAFRACRAISLPGGPLRTLQRGVCLGWWAFRCVCLVYRELLRTAPRSPPCWVRNGSLLAADVGRGRSRGRHSAEQGAKEKAAGPRN